MPRILKKLRNVVIVVVVMFVGIMIYSVVKNRPLTPTQQYYQTYQQPDVQFVRKALNSYLAGDNTVAIAQTAIETGDYEGHLQGLNSFSKDYYKSKFVVYRVDPNLTGGEDIQIIFQEKPDRIFTAWVFKGTNDVYELRGFSSLDPPDAKLMESIKKNVGSMLSDPVHSL